MEKGAVKVLNTYLYCKSRPSLEMVLTSKSVFKLVRLAKNGGRIKLNIGAKFRFSHGRGLKSSRIRLGK